MLRLSLLSVLSSVALGAGALVHAADGGNPPTATVNMKYLFAAHPKTQEAETQIEAERALFKKVLEDAEAKVERIRMAIKELDADLAGGKLGATAQEQTTTIRKEKAAELQVLEAQVQALREQGMKDLQNASLRMRDAILDAINADIAKTPQLRSAELILDKSGPSTNAVPFVLYSNDSLELTGAVRKQMRAGSTGGMMEGEVGQGLAVVVVDVKRVFESYAKTREAQERIDAARASMAGELQERLAVAASLSDTIQKLDQQLVDPTLGDMERMRRRQERGNKALELQTVERENAEFRQTREKQLQEQYVRMRDGIADDINKVIVDGVRAEGRVDLILDASGISLNGAPILLRSQGVADWTEALITKLNSAKGGANRVHVAWEGGTTSIAKLRFAVVDVQRVIESQPAMKAAKEAAERASAEIKEVVDSGGDAKAKQEEIEKLVAGKKAEAVESVRKQIQMSAVKAGAHVVLDSSGASLNGVPLVTAHRNVPDLSNDIITVLGGAVR